MAGQDNQNQEQHAALADIRDAVINGSTPPLHAVGIYVQTIGDRLEAGTIDKQTAVDQAHIAAGLIRCIVDEGAAS